MPAFAPTTVGTRSNMRIGEMKRLGWRTGGRAAQIGVTVVRERIVKHFRESVLRCREQLYFSQLVERDCRSAHGAFYTSALTASGPCDADAVIVSVLTPSCCRSTADERVSFGISMAVEYDGGASSLSVSFERFS